VQMSLWRNWMPLVGLCCSAFVASCERPPSTPAPPMPDLVTPNPTPLAQTLPHATLPPPSTPVPQRSLDDVEPQCAVVDLPALSSARLLTNNELQRSVDALFGLDINVTDGLPSENRVEGFAGHHRSHQASPQLLERWMLHAENVSEQALATRRSDILSRCFLDADGTPLVEGQCADKVIDDWLRRIFRRPATVDEATAYRSLYDLARTRLTFDESVALLLSAALQSPSFLYRTEWVDDVELPQVIDPFALASRLSFFLTQGPPDDALLDVAASGTLLDDNVLRDQAASLLNGPHAEHAVTAFANAWLGLDALAALQKDEQRYPGFAPDMREAYALEAQRFVRDVVFDDDGGTFADLFSRNKSRITPALASIYNTGDAVLDDDGTLFQHPADERAGVLTLSGVQALLAGAEQSSPILRGIFVRERILCEPLPPPPDDIPIVAPEVDDNSTTRERFAQHTESESCANCHVLIDPIGFGFENYDATGRFRRTENNLPVDATGELLYTYDADETVEGPFDGAVQLTQRLAVSAQAKRCFAQQWMRFAFGRGPRAEDACLLDDIEASFVAGDGDIKNLMLTIATHPSFKLRAPTIVDDVSDAGGAP